MTALFSSGRGGATAFRQVRAGFASSLLILAAALGACDRGPDLEAEPAEVRAALRTMLASDSAAVLVEERRAVARRVYEARDYAPLWIDGGATDRLRALVEAICTAERDGLHPWDYDLAGAVDVLRALQEKGETTPDDVAALELRFTGLFLEYGGDLAAGRHDPRRVEREWYIRTPQPVIDSLLAQALAGDTFEEMRAGLVPEQEEYRALADALRRYRAIDSAGGWPAIPDGTAPRVGAADPRVPLLRQRLAITGDLAGGGRTDSIFDAELAAAVARAQARHGLEVDSTLGRRTLAALNVPVEDRIRQIELNLERMRWLPRSLGERHILVNIPNYYLHAYDSGRRVLDMKVVVGEEYRSATPVFSDSMDHVVFRPYWNIPESILAEEILPRALEDPSFLTRNRYELVRSAEEPEPVPLDDVEWAGPDDGEFPYLARQQPGAQNSLGLVKFMFPNRFSIYLHDTPADHLFEETERAYSHGCIRVEDPVALAKFVFEGSPEWTESRIRAAMAPDAPDARTVALERKVPVYILYLTAFAQDGEVHFRDDLYGMDARALARLAEEERRDVSGVCAELRDLLDG
jgi:murein L,D-transpeptidase YcbB/YkuD